MARGAGCRGATGGLPSLPAMRERGSTGVLQSARRTPAEFVRKWTATTRTERAAAPEHFIDLCRMLGEKTPNEADPSGDFYAFEKGAAKSSGEDGFADVWLDGHFGWEYKGKRKDLNAAYVQLLNYHEALNQPPLRVVCDLDRFEVHTKWAGKEPGKEPWGDPLVEAISEAARELNELRERWLNPPAGDGVGLSESELKKRTLTNLYNERPAWLEHAHRKLDAAVRAAYGWPDGMDDQEILARLLELNRVRAGGE